MPIILLIDNIQIWRYTKQLTVNSATILFYLTRSRKRAGAAPRSQTPSAHTMPYQLLIRPDENLLFLLAPETSSVAKAIDTINRLATLDIPRPDGLLIDLRKPTQVITCDDAERLVQSCGAAAEIFAGRLVYLTSTMGLYGVSRMVAALASDFGYDAHSARNEQEACALLGALSIPTDNEYALHGLTL